MRARHARRAGSALRQLVRHPKRVLGFAAELDDTSGASLGEHVRRSVAPDVARAAAVQIMSYDGVLLDFERDGFRWQVDSGDEIGCSVYATGTYQGTEIEALLAWLASDSTRRTVLDLGANVGTTSVPFARAGYHVVAVEPVPTTYAMLTSNVQRNELDTSIECVQAAVATADGVLDMWTGFASGQAEVAVADQDPAMTRGGRGRGELISVDARRLDTLLREHAVAPSDVALVWADVQGSETAVIETGAPLWRDKVPLYLEVYPPGLRLHAGLPAFLDAVTANFTSFLTSEDLQSTARARPIEGFEAFAASLEDDYGDALLLPHGLAAS